MKKEIYDIDENSLADVDGYSLGQVGLRIKEIRTKILKLSQAELADILDSKQELISRLENGKGGSLYLYLDFLRLLDKRGYRAHMIFAPHYSIDNLEKNESINVQRINHLINLQINSNTEALTLISLMLENE